jgi:UDP-N-acetyl-D-galactosamine dehydrogenase
VIRDGRAQANAVQHEYGIELTPIEELRDLGALIYAVAHDEYRALHDRIGDMVMQDGVIADVRAPLDRTALPLIYKRSVIDRQIK